MEDGKATKETDGPFLKACHVLSSGINLNMAAQVSMELYEMLVGEEKTHHQ